MNHVNKIIQILIMGVLILSLSACGRIKEVVSDLISSDQPQQAGGDISGEGLKNLLSDLRSAGVEVNIAGQIEQPFLPVSGQIIEVNGASVQVFEFTDPSSRQKVSDTISTSGDKIGTFIPSWIGKPNFWADGNLIVLYVGENQALIELLSSFLGYPITQAGDSGELTPEAVLNGQRVLAQELNVALHIVQLLEYEHSDWTDSCLGLGRADEGCLTVITPGWRANFDVNGQLYEVRTNKSGDIIRWQRMEAKAFSGKRFIYLIAIDSSEGEVIGCGDALIPVEIELRDSNQPIQDALNRLLLLNKQYYGESGLYNALYQSRLVVDSMMLDTDGTARIYLSGELVLGGTCDVPRVQAQLEYTVIQFDSVSAVEFFVNGKPIDELLSGSGQSDQSVDYNGISFVVPSMLARQVISSNAAAEAAETGIPFISQIPEHIRFDFQDYVDSKAGISAQLRVVSVEKLRALQPSAGNLIALLRTVMTIQPELLIKYIGVLPFVDTSEMMFAQIQTLEFQNGTGVRFLTQYSPGGQAINNQQLFYTYQGLTDDGEYYVAAILPVSHADLPDTAQELTDQERAAIQSDYSAYLEEITQMLDTESPSSFTPDLTILDEMIVSLQISASQ